MVNDFEIELKTGFLEEATQLLGDTEQCFLSLESNSEDTGILEKIFRLAHNIKGSARAVGFDSLGAFTHEFESFLLKCKSGKIAITPSTVSLLLKCNDHVKDWVQSLRADLNAKLSNDELIREIAEFNPDGPTAEPKPGLLPYSTPSAEAFEAEAAAAERSESAQPAEGAQSSESSQPSESSTANALSPPAPERLRPVQQASADESIRVSLARVDALVNFVGELVILQTVLNQQKERHSNLLLNRTIDQLSKVSKEIQSLSMGMRMIPLKQTFLKMQRIVRDTASALGKKVQLQLVGEDTELDKTVLENLGDPLVHLVRNACDHGIEPAADRLLAGKPEQGTVKLKAFNQGDRIVIEVSDDGGGLDPARILAKAIEKGVASPSAKLSDSDCFQLLFKPGFSTKSQVTDISGRGVGLDVVKTNIEQLLQGEVQIESTLGAGTTFRIVLPLTLAITDGMIVRCGAERYIIPLTQVFETLRPAPGEVQSVTGMGEVLRLRGENLPVYRMVRLLARGNAPGGDASDKRAIEDLIVIVVRSARVPFAVAVDDIIGQHQMVIKPLGREVRNIRGFSGSAILGDGVPGIILDLPELIQSRLPQAGKSKGAA